MAKAPKKKRPRRTTGFLHDNDKKKHFPNGIAATVLALVNYWLNLTEQKPEFLSVEDFVKESDLVNIYNTVALMYGGVANAAENDGGVEGLIGGLTRNEQALHYIHLRALADLVKIPTGLLLLFTQMVSDEYRALLEEEDRGKPLETIRSAKAVLEAAEIAAQAAYDNGTLAFVHLYKDFKEPPRDRYMARARTLLEWRNIYTSVSAKERAAAVAANIEVERKP
jgi:hypothetical protein